jgi:hypothetical protein
MTGKGIGFGLRLLVLAFGITSAACEAISPSDLNWNSFEYDFQKDNHKLTGHWKGKDSWAGRWCDGYYEYDVDAGTVVSTVDFELNDNGTVGIYADLRDLFAGAHGTYRSAWTLCFPWRGWTGIGADRAEIFTEAVFEGDGESFNQIRVRVITTRLGAVHIGKYVPRWFERFLTNTLNHALSKIWASRLGEWISGKISDIIKEKIPVDARGNLVRGGYRR